MEEEVLGVLGRDGVDGLGQGHVERLGGAGGGTTQDCLILAKAFSMGEKSGSRPADRAPLAPRASITWRTCGSVCDYRLSNTTIWPRRKAGTRLSRT